jgi:hypothetical protein
MFSHRGNGHATSAVRHSPTTDDYGLSQIVHMSAEAHAAAIRDTGDTDNFVVITPATHVPSFLAVSADCTDTLQSRSSIVQQPATKISQKNCLP